MHSTGNRVSLPLDSQVILAHLRLLSQGETWHGDGDETLPDDDQWIDADQLTLLEELGRGAFGVGMQRSLVVFWRWSCPGCSVCCTLCLNGWWY
jgi:hypothetical protein